MLVNFFVFFKRHFDASRILPRRYVYTIDDDCLPAEDEQGFKINPLALHLRNLRSPSTPYFFNTLYDPYVDGSDFVRGLLLEIS